MVEFFFFEVLHGMGPLHPFLCCVFCKLLAKRERFYIPPLLSSRLSLRDFSRFDLDLHGHSPPGFVAFVGLFLQVFTFHLRGGAMGKPLGRVS